MAATPPTIRYSTPWRSRTSMRRPRSCGGLSGSDIGADVLLGALRCHLCQPLHYRFPRIQPSAVPENGHVVRGRGRGLTNALDQLLGGHHGLRSHAFRIPAHRSPNSQLSDGSLGARHDLLSSDDPEWVAVSPRPVNRAACRSVGPWIGGVGHRLNNTRPDGLTCGGQLSTPAVQPSLHGTHGLAG